MDADFLDQPLFVEPYEEMEREDEWSGNKGFILGGMALPTKEQLSEQYFDAANFLLDSIITLEIADYRIANPALYLFRHSLELQLKALTGSTSKKHDLRKLAFDLDRLLKTRRSESLPNWISARLTELAAIDPASTAFRYAENYDPGTKSTNPVDGEVCVDVIHLKAIMAALRSALLDLKDSLAD